MKRFGLLFLWVPLIGLAVVVTACGNKRDVYFYTASGSTPSEALKVSYSYDALHWYPLDSPLFVPALGDKKLVDPVIVQGQGEDYFLVWVACVNGKQGLGYASSTNLTQWSSAGFIALTDNDSLPDTLHAPSVCYLTEERCFQLLWTSVSGENSCIYSLTTPDFITFSKAKRLFDPGFAVTESFLVNRGIDDYVLIFRDASPTVNSLKVAFSHSSQGPFERISSSITAFETGYPAVVKVGAYWRIYHQSTTTNTLSAVETVDFDGFETLSTDFSHAPNHGHGSIFTVKRAVMKHVFRKLQCKRVPE